MISFRTIDQVQQWALQSLLDSGAEVAPRGLRTRELEAMQFRLENPRARCVTNSTRRWSFPVALGEFTWHAGGNRDLRHLAYYLPRWVEFSDDRCAVRGSCYGWRIFRSRGDRGSQWERVLGLLRTDPDSRRAVMTLHSPAALLDAHLKDIPCALAMQFFIRDGTLDAICTMRSNDVIWGLPYDMFLFTMLQELLASHLGVPLGTYTHFAGSMHLYERHYTLARRIVGGPIAESGVMRPLENPEQLPLFLAHEAWLRNQSTPRPDAELSSPYWRELLGVLESFAAGHSAAPPEL